MNEDFNHFHYYVKSEAKLDIERPEIQKIEQCSTVEELEKKLKEFFMCFISFF